MEGPFEQDHEHVLETQPGGSLEPPGRLPPLAVGAATPDDEAPHRELHSREGQIRLADVPMLLIVGLQRVMRSAARVLAHR